MYYTLVSGDSIKFIQGNQEISLEEFFADYPPTIFYADNSISYGLNFVNQNAKLRKFPIV